MNNNSDPRLGDLMLPPTDENLTAADVVIIGVPTDEGILRNGGRTGAAQAPTEVRKYLQKLTPFFGESSLEPLRVVDHGNVSGRSLEELHERARELTTKLVRDQKVVIALGGGHDITYPLASGFREGANTPMSLVNVDAHLDVRPKKNGEHHSGSSFRLLIEEGYLEGSRFVEFGIQPFAMSAEHFGWATAQGVSVIRYDAMKDTIFSTFTDFARAGIDYLSFDIDSIRSADAPGCSAPSPVGLSAYEACEIASIAAMNGTRMFDIVEVSPPYDIDGRTSRLAARMIAYFLRGIVRRREDQ